MDAEFRFHHESLVDTFMSQGLRRKDAERKARREFGPVELAKDQSRDQRPTAMAEQLLADIRYGCRGLRKSPGFAVASILVLTLGIGANTAVYQLFDAVRLRTVPVEDPEQLAIVELADLTRWNGRRTTGYPVLTNPLWEEFRDHQDVFSGVVAWANSEFRLDQSTDSTGVRGLFVSGEFFNVLGVDPLLGRVFTSIDDRPGCGLPGAVVSYGFWQRQFGGDPAAVGSTVALNAQRVEVIGITPASFTGLEIGRSYDVAVPTCSHEDLGREAGWLENGRLWWLTVMGRAAPGQSLEIVNAQLPAASSGLFEATLPPDLSSDDASDYLSLRLRAAPGALGVSALRSRYGGSLQILLILTGLVLLIACTNLANLILARASARGREFSVRLALGASRGRLVRQLMIENSLLALGGATAGLVLAGMLSRFLIAFLGTGLSLDVAVNARLVVFVVSVAGLTCLTFGVCPAWLTASRPAGMGALRGRGISASRRALGLRQLLVVSQLALSLILLVGALLFASTLRNLLAVDTGFEYDGVTIARLDFSQLEIRTEGRPPFKRDVLDAIRSAPGVSSAAEVRHVPLGGTGSSITVWREGADPTGKIPVRLNAMSDDFLDTMDIGLVAGRDFSVRDEDASPIVAIVNRTFARQLGFEGNPVGRTFLSEGQSSNPTTAFEIIGLVPDTKHFTLREEFLPIAFIPFANANDQRPFTDLVIRSSAPLGNVSSSVRRAVAGVSPLINTNLRSLGDQIGGGLLRERLMATLSGFFGALATLVSGIGLYGILSFLVARRTNEIAVRMALGAQRSDILALVVRQAGTLLAFGLGAGAMLALVGAGAAQSLVFGVRPTDLGLVGLAVALLATVGVAASYLPARRAASVEPLAALRAD
jgi:predicted permease